LEQRVVHPEAVGSNTGGHKVVFDFIDDLFNNSAAIVKPPDALRVQMKVGDNYFIAARKHVEQVHLRRRLFGRLVAFNDAKTAGTGPAGEPTAQVGGKMPVADIAPFFNTGDVAHHIGCQFDLGNVTDAELFNGIKRIA